MENVEIRPVKLGDAKGIGYVNFKTWQTTYTGLMPDEIIQGLDLNKNIALWNKILSINENTENSENKNNKRQSVTFVAVAKVTILPDISPGQIIGFINGGRNRDPKYPYEGEIYALYLLKSIQRHGVGKRLFTKMLASLKKMHISNMIIWVLQKNPAEYFYQDMGGVQKYIKKDIRGSVELCENGYVWDSLHTFESL